MSSLHRAEHILEAVKARLTGLATTGSNVQRARVYNFADTVRDALTIQMGADAPIDQAGDGNIAFRDHVLEVQVTAHVKSTAIDTRLNLIKAEVIVAMLQDRTLGLSYVIDTDEQGWQAPIMTDESDMRAAQCTGIFTVHYRRSYNDPTQ